VNMTVDAAITEGKALCEIRPPWFPGDVSVAVAVLRALIAELERRGAASALTDAQIAKWTVEAEVVVRGFANYIEGDGKAAASLGAAVPALIAEIARLRAIDVSNVGDMITIGDANVDLRAEVARLREALLVARQPCAIAASYLDDPNISIGLRLHAEDCAAAIRSIDAVLKKETP
jgi:hypothetical protein